MAKTEPSAEATAERIVDAHVDGLGAWTTETFSELLATLKAEFAIAIDAAVKAERMRCLMLVERIGYAELLEKIAKGAGLVERHRR